jgi:hypothetical protein
VLEQWKDSNSRLLLRKPPGGSASSTRCGKPRSMHMPSDFGLATAYLAQSSSASRFTAEHAGLFDLSQANRASTRLARLNLALQFEEVPIGAVETLRQNRCNVKECDRVYPEYGGRIGVSRSALRRVGRRRETARLPGHVHPPCAADPAARSVRRTRSRVKAASSMAQRFSATSFVGSAGSSARSRARSADEVRFLSTRSLHVFL